MKNSIQSQSTVGLLVNAKKSKLIILAIISIAFTLYRFTLIVSKEAIFDVYDSAYYFNFNLVNSFRLPVITGIYSLIEDYQKIILFQNIISSFAWITFASISITLLRSYYLKVLLFSSILILGSTKIAIFRDIYLMSESLTLSTFLLVVSSLIFFLRKTSFFRFCLLLVSFLAFSGIKSTNTLTVLVFLLLAIAAIAYLTRFSLIRKSFVFALFLFSIPFIAFTYSSLSSDVTAQLNTSAHINGRLWTNSDWRDQVLNSGYPPELRTIWRDRVEYNLGEPPDQGVINEEIYQEWWLRGGDKFLINFMVRNIDYTLIGPFALPLISDKANFSHTLIHGWSQDPNFFARDLIAYSFIDHLWPQSRANAYLVLGISIVIIGVFVFLQFRFEPTTSRKLTAFLIFVILIIWSLISWWFGSKPGSDILRHQESVAILLRALSMTGLVYLLDVSWTRDRPLR